MCDCRALAHGLARKNEISLTITLFGQPFANRWVNSKIICAPTMGRYDFGVWVISTSHV